MNQQKHRTLRFFTFSSKNSFRLQIFRPKISQSRYFQFIAIVENFLPANDLILLKAQLIPVYTISLHYLKDEDVISFIRLYSEKNHLDWSDAYIHSLAYLAKGYPLGMIEMIKKKRRL